MSERPCTNCGGPNTDGVRLGSGERVHTSAAFCLAHVRASLTRRAEAAEQEAAGLRLMLREIAETNASGIGHALRLQTERDEARAMADDAKRTWVLRAESLHEERRRAGVSFRMLESKHAAMHRRAQEAERLVGLAMRVGGAEVDSLRWRLTGEIADVHHYAEMSSRRLRELATERATLDDAKRAWVLRAESLHEEVRRLRAGLQEMSAALSQIDYACGEPNEMHVSGYDVHCDPGAVVANVRETIAAIEDGTCEDLPALLRRYGKMRAVVEAGRIIYAKACHMSECYERCNCGLDELSAALAALDEGGSDV